MNLSPAADAELQRILSRKADVTEDAATVEMERKRALLARVRVLSEGNLSAINLIRNKHPDYVYIWAYNHVDRISSYESMQAELVRDQDKVETNFKREDGTHVRGDTILMRMHKDISDAYNAMREVKAFEAVEGYKDDGLSFGQRSGIPVYRRN